MCLIIRMQSCVCLVENHDMKFLGIFLKKALIRGIFSGIYGKDRLANLVFICF